MSVRAKFRVVSKEETVYAGSSEVMTTVKLDPVYKSEDPNSENSQFWKYSPIGKIELGTINKVAADQFVLGGEYYIDFTPAATGAQSEIAEFVHPNS